MRRLVALVGSTTNKFEQTRSVRVRDFDNGLHPQSLNPDVKALDDIRGLLAMASLRMSQPAISLAQTCHGPRSQVP
jgi:hypothetical protein